MSRASEMIEPLDDLRAESSEKEKKAIEREEEDERTQRPEEHGKPSDVAAAVAASKKALIRFAPLNIPLERRLQTLSVLLIILEPLLCLLVSFIIIRLSGWMLYVFLVYMVWMSLFQRFHVTGALYARWARKSPIWKLFCGYFPLRLHKTAEITPDRSYIFGVHPHGMISFGALGNFGTDATGFDSAFPGIRLHLVTLHSNFRVPIHSLVVGLHGVCDASKITFNNILSRGNGHSIMVAIGGAKESLDSRPGTYDLTLKCRKGFVKMALLHGAGLVPVFSFGETDVYGQVANPRGSALRVLQEKMQQKLGFAVPFIYGRGVFNYDFGLLPYRKPITSVIGAPIDVPKLSREQITQAIIDEYHAKYIDALQALYNEFKDVYARNRSSSLKIVR